MANKEVRLAVEIDSPSVCIAGALNQILLKSLEKIKKNENK